MRSLFGHCLHRNLSFPQTPVSRSRFGTRPVGRPAVACLSCGKRFEYDWDEMKVGAEIKEGAVPSVVVEVERG